MSLGRAEEHSYPPQVTQGADRTERTRETSRKRHTGLSRAIAMTLVLRSSRVQRGHCMTRQRRIA